MRLMSDRGARGRSALGASTVLVYERSGDHAYIATIDPKARTTDDVLHTDGIDVTNERISPQFPYGLLVMQDGENEGRQNFKFIAWEDVAAGRLMADTKPLCRAMRSASSSGVHR
jgi:3-phytase